MTYANTLRVTGSLPEARGLATRVEADPCAAALSLARQIATRHPAAIRAAVRAASR